MVKQNLGKLDRIFRFVLALWWLGPFTPQFKLAQASWNVNLHWIVMVVGAIALIEAFVGWCWLHNLLHIGNKNQ